MTTLKQVIGDTAEWVLTDIRDKDGVLVASGTAHLVVKDDWTDTDAQAVIEAEATIVAGAATIIVPPTETSGLPNTARWLGFDIQVRQGTGRWTLFKGTYILEPQVAFT